jgi:hypothetical protein
MHTKCILTCESIIDDKSPLPSPAATEEEDAILLQDEAYVDGPIKIDYGFNVRYVFKVLEPPSLSKLIDTDLAKEFKSTTTAPSLTPARSQLALVL